MKRSQIKRRPLADTVLASLEPEDCQILLKSAPRLWCKRAPPKNDV